MCCSSAESGPTVAGYDCRPSRNSSVRARCSPGCGVPAIRKKEWVTTRPRDLPMAARRCALRSRERRWCCVQGVLPAADVHRAGPQGRAAVTSLTGLRAACPVRTRTASSAAMRRTVATACSE
ncbi:transposase family protein [Nonomuraea sp. NPDC048826]|uniref:transposase family protein n=1 Tax=Nonomuraea sp. NPDC048826 TaxID=3364347 RepID=UPI00371E48DF